LTDIPENIRPVGQFIFDKYERVIKYKSQTLFLLLLLTAGTAGAGLEHAAVDFSSERQGRFPSFPHFDLKVKRID
jgi:hypothetical protein